MKTFIKLACSLIIILSFSACTRENTDKQPNNTTKFIENKDVNIPKDSNPQPKVKIEIEPDNTSIKKDDKKTFHILTQIKDRAKDGKIINSDFKAGVSIIDEVINSLGKADSQNYIESARGTYCPYSKNNVAFGCNKGGRIFEIRSFDSSLNNIHLSDVKNAYKLPKYNLLTKDNERILGYKINNDYKILLVFKNGNEKNPTLSHYSVFYPQGTKNSMSNLPGREW